MSAADPAGSTWTATSAHGTRVADRVGGLIAAHLTELDGVDAVAEAVGYSPFHLMRLFQRETGAGLGATITARRFELAKDLLLAGATVTEACHESGFNSLGTFSRRFRSEVGVSPSAFAGLRGPVEDWLAGPGAATTPAPPPGPTVQVIVEVAEGLGDDLDVYVGFYPGGVASAAPVSGNRRRGSGAVLLGRPPDGTYRLLASAVPATDAAAMLAPPRFLAGRAPAPVQFTRGAAHSPLHVPVGPAPLWVPPVVTALPVVAMRRDDAWGDGR